MPISDSTTVKPEDTPQISLQKINQNFIDGAAKVQLSAADIEIGAVEIKNSTDDTRATVGANGLYADVRALPSNTVAGGTSLPAGTNNIGDVDVLSLPAGTVAGGSSLPAGTNNIGDVDVLSLPASTVAGSSSLPAGTNNIGDVDVLTLPSNTVAGGASLPSGTNNIGDVDIASIAAGDNNIGNVDLASAIPAGANLIGLVSASGETSTVYNGTTALTPKFARINVSSSGDNTATVAGVTGKKIRVLSYDFVAAGAVTVNIKSSTTTVLAGPYTLAANGGVASPESLCGRFETASGEGLVFNLSGAVAVGGCLTYVEV